MKDEEIDLSDEELKELELENIPDRWKRFVENYLRDWNITRAYLKAFVTCTNPDSAAASGSKLLRHPKIKAYIELMQKRTEQMAGISRLRVAEELKAMAFSSIAHLHDSWVTRREFDSLTDEEKRSISEMKTRVLKTEAGDIEEVFIKLHDKKAALTELSRMFGYNEPDKVDLTTKGKEINLSSMSNKEILERAKALAHLKENEK